MASCRGAAKWNWPYHSLPRVITGFSFRPGLYWRRQRLRLSLCLAKDWVQVGVKITGTIQAEYSYSNPVSGEVQLRATKYIGTWQEFATATYTLDGSVNFELPAPGYVAGVPTSGGQGNVSIEIAVKEKATGYEGNLKLEQAVILP